MSKIVTIAKNSDLEISEVEPLGGANPRPYSEEKIAKLIDSYLSCLEDYGSTFSLTVPNLAKSKTNELRKVAQRIDTYSSKVEKNGETHLVANGVHAASRLSEAIIEADRILESKSIASLIKSLFIGLFTEYDHYIGQLLKALYEEQPNLLKGISREISLTELLDFMDIEEVKISILEKEIESFRRESYVSQFQQLETKFKVTTLRNFEEWQEFVELSQRRNLFVHNNGVVSQQYLSICQKEKCAIDPKLKVGSALEISIEYYFRAIFVLSKVGFMLAHTLWSKVIPNKSQLAADAMNNSIFLLLKSERWKTASEFGIFGLTDVYLKNIDDITKKIRVINTAIALKNCKKEKEALEQIERVDWSSALRDFKLAVAIIKKDYLEASLIMKQIGKQGEMIGQISYHGWPLFREFRDTKEFQMAYESIYGISFIEKTSEEAAVKSKAIKKETKLVKPKRK